jgi:hypothetical protein
MQLIDSYGGSIHKYESDRVAIALSVDITPRHVLGQKRLLFLQYRVRWQRKVPSC